MRKIAYLRATGSLTEVILEAGFVLVDSTFRPLYANTESIRILAYPNSVSSPSTLDGILFQKILSLIPRDLDLSGGTFITQFQSGRRNYTCRVFVLRDHWESPGDTRIAILMERGLAAAGKQRKGSDAPGDPFSFAPDNACFYFGRSRREVFTTLLDMIRQRRGTGVLLAQAGMGKTALLEALAGTVRSESDVAFLPGSFETRLEMVRAVMGAFGVECPAGEPEEQLRCFHDWLLLRHQAGRGVTLICDDAQDLSFEILEGLLNFSSLQSGGQKLVQVVLAGRQRLLEKLTSFKLERLTGDTHVYCRLAPMDDAEVRGYIVHRLQVAGCSTQVFTTAALASISLYSRGIPLNVNMICRHSISLAATINLQVVDERIVADSAYDLVLRAQPAEAWDGHAQAGEPKRPAGLLRDRRGLRLVRKSETVSH